MKKSLVIILVILSITLLLAAGCSKKTPTPTSSPTPTATPTPTPISAQEILNKAGEALSGVKSFHFVLEHVGGGTPITMGIEMTGASGDIVKPDQMQTTIDGTAMGMMIEVKLVTIGDKTYMTNPLSGNWEIPPDQFKVLSIFDPGTGIPSIIKGITDSEVLVDETIAGTSCYHLKGTVISDALSPLTGSAISGTAINTEIWIGKTDFMARQIKLNGQITELEKPGIIRTLSLSSFNQDVSIKLPE